MMLNCTLQICHSSLTLAEDCHREADGAARMKKIRPGHKDKADGGGGNRSDVKEVPFAVLPSFLPYSLFSRCCVLLSSSSLDSRGNGIVQDAALIQRKVNCTRCLFFKLH